MRGDVQVWLKEDEKKGLFDSLSTINKWKKNPQLRGFTNGNKI
jgi:hypothetical protein